MAPGADGQKLPQGVVQVALEDNAVAQEAELRHVKLQEDAQFTNAQFTNEGPSLDEACSFEELLRCIAKKHADLQMKCSQLAADLSRAAAPSPSVWSGESSPRERLPGFPGLDPLGELRELPWRRTPFSGAGDRLWQSTGEAADLDLHVSEEHSIGDHLFDDQFKQAVPLDSVPMSRKMPLNVSSSNDPLTASRSGRGVSGRRVDINGGFSGVALPFASHKQVRSPEAEAETTAEGETTIAEMTLGSCSTEFPLAIDRPGGDKEPLAVAVGNSDIHGTEALAANSRLSSATQCSNGNSSALSRLKTQFHRLDLRCQGLVTAWDCHQCMRAVHHLNLARKPPSLREVRSAVKEFTTEVRCLSVWKEAEAEDRESVVLFPDTVGLDFTQFACLMADVENEEERVPRLHGVMLRLREALNLEARNRIVQLRTHRMIVKTKSLAINGSSHLLDSVSAVVICLNALVLGVSSDVEQTSIIWQDLEFVFTSYFTMELMYKLYVFGARRFFCGIEQRWNLFDILVVGIALADASLTIWMRTRNVSVDDGGDLGGLFPIIKMVRLGRLARLVRLLRLEILRELKSMIQGVFAGARVLFWAVVLLFVIIYLLAVVMRKMVGDSPDSPTEATTLAFETLPNAMFTIFRCITAGCAAFNGTPLEVHLMKAYGINFMLPYIILILCVTIGVFNLIMAIFIDNVMNASVQRKQRERGENAEAMEIKLKELILQLATNQRDSNSEMGFDGADPSAAMDDIKVTREQFSAWLEKEEFLDLLTEMDIGSSNKSELFETLDFDISGELEASEVITGLMKLRGPSDKCDAVAMLLGLRYVTKMVEEVHSLLGVERVTAAAVGWTTLGRRPMTQHQTSSERRRPEAPANTARGDLFRSLRTTGSPA